jgi:hypothetical protein
MTLPTTRAAWLRFLKEHGQESGGVSNFATILDTYPIKVKQAIDPLVLAGYVTMTGKPGRGGGFTYSVTSLGHRYLNENPEELTGEHAEAATDIEVSAKKEPPAPTPVPASPGSSANGAPQTSIPAMFPTRRPHMSQHRETRPDLDPALKDALFDELYERFGEQVSAKQLLDRMKANASRSGDGG